MPEDDNKDNDLESSVSSSEDNLLDSNNTAIADEEIEKEDPEANDAIESQKPIDLDAAPIQKTSHKKYRLSKIEKLKKQTNLYLLLFGLIVLIAIIIAIVAYSQSKNASSAKIKSQNLTQNDLNQLANNDVTLGANNNILNVESSAVFAGQVLLKQSLQIAGNLVVGGISTVNGINIAGSSQFNEVEIAKNLAVTGNTSVQGSVSIAKNLQVNGSGIFNGTLSAPQITTNSLQINGDLVLSHHISTTGGIPTRSGGAALGSGGSVAVSGTDTAGSVTINVGSNPVAGCFATINFNGAYAVIPYIQVTPVGFSAGGINYYISKTNSGFSICDANVPPASVSFGFDYFVID